MKIVRAFNLVIAFLAIVVSSSRSEAGSLEPPASVLAAVPRSAELVLIVDGLGAMKDGAVARSLWSIVKEIESASTKVGGEGGHATIEETWARLAAELRMTKAEAFDRLMGTRFMLVIRDMESSDTRRWAAVSVISEATDRELVSTLRPARRDVFEGHAIRSIESGKYEVTTHLHDAAGAPGLGKSEKPKREKPAGATGDRMVSLLLSESGKSELFDDLVGVWSGRVSDTLGGHDVAREAARFGDARVLLAIRVDPENPSQRRAENDWENFILLAGNVTPNGFEFKALLRDRAFERELGRIGPSSDAPMKLIENGAALAVIETRLRPPSPLEPKAVGNAAQSPTHSHPSHQHTAASAPPNPVERLFSLLGLSDEIEDRLNGRQLLVVSTNERRGGAVAGKDGNSDETPTLMVCVGAETNNLSTLATLGDAYMNERVASIERDFGAVTAGGKTGVLPVADHGAANPPELNLLGVACNAPRRTSAKVTEASPFGKFFGTPMAVAWTYVSTPGKGVGAGKSDDRGWWVVQIGSEGGEGSGAWSVVKKGTGAGAGDKPGEGNANKAKGEPPAWTNRATRDRFDDVCRAVGPDGGGGRVGEGRDGDVKRWFSLGVLRPEPLLEALSQLVANQPVGNVLKKIESLEWRLFVNQSQDLEGTVNVRMNGGGKDATKAGGTSGVSVPKNGKGSGVKER